MKTKDYKFSVWMDNAHKFDPVLVKKMPLCYQIEIAEISIFLTNEAFQELKNKINEVA